MKNKISGAEHRSKSKTNENLKIGRKGVQKGRTWYNHSGQLTCASIKLDASSAYVGRIVGTRGCNAQGESKGRAAWGASLQAKPSTMWRQQALKHGQNVSCPKTLVH